jgi:hypothetical protein
MTPLSILPGRIRLESPSLAGRPEACSSLIRQLMALSGVREVAFNSRTGRTLVRFDEGTLPQQDLLRLIEAFLETHRHASLPVAPRRRREASRGRILSPVAGSLLRDAVAHALLPAPFDLLLPAAITALRR